MADALVDYYNALNRLKNGYPTVVAKGTKITNDSVSLEAGRNKGSIKKSRAVFHDLIIAIEAAALLKSSPHKKEKDNLALAKSEAEEYRRLWEESLAREISLVRQLRVERSEWAAEKAALTGEKISSILARKGHLKAKRSSE